MIFPIGRVVAPIAAPVFFTAVRMLLAGIALLAYQWVQFGISRNIRKALWAILGFSITGIFLTNVPEFWGLQYLPASKASFIYSLSPFAAALFSYFFFDEIMTFNKLIGMAIGFVGFCIMIVVHAPGEVSFNAFGCVSYAEFALIIAALSSAAGWIIIRKKVRKAYCTPQEVLGISMLLGSAYSFLASLALEPWHPVPIYHYPNDVWIVIGYLLLGVLFSNVIGYVLYTHLLKTYTATFLSFAGFVEPLSAAVIGWFFLGEPITWYFLLATTLVFLGLYIFYLEELRLGYIVKASKGT